MGQGGVRVSAGTWGPVAGFLSQHVGSGKSCQLSEPHLPPLWVGATVHPLMELLWVD